MQVGLPHLEVVVLRIVLSFSSKIGLMAYSNVVNVVFCVCMFPPCVFSIRALMGVGGTGER